jgi:hypothetical protein
MSKKMTKKDYFTAIMEKYPLSADEKAFVEHELELLAKKNSSEKKPSKTQQANSALQEELLEQMEENRLYSITEMIKELPACAELTNQKVSALVRALTPDRIERIEDKRKAYFRKVSV